MDEDAFCRRHARAYESVVERYPRWKKALEIDVEGYLEWVRDLEETGEWVVEVCDYLLAEEPQDLVEAIEE